MLVFLSFLAIYKASYQDIFHLSLLELDQSSLLPFFFQFAIHGLFLKFNPNAKKLVKLKKKSYFCSNTAYNLQNKLHFLFSFEIPSGSLCIFHQSISMVRG